MSKRFSQWDTCCHLWCHSFTKEVRALIIALKCGPFSTQTKMIHMARHHVERSTLCVQMIKMTQNVAFAIQHAPFDMVIGLNCFGLS